MKTVLDTLTQSTIDDWHTKTLALDTPEIIQEAKEIAFYSTMIWAANDDPLDDPDDQELALSQFKEKLEEHTQKYADLVNDAV